MFGNVRVRCLGRFFAASILILLMISVPLSSQVIGSVKSEQTVVCCQDAHDVKLFMTGGDNGELTPFEQKLSDEESSAVIVNSITSEEQVGIWSLGKVWPGDIPQSNWDFEIHYRVSDAGGAQINASATIMIGSQEYTDSTDVDSSVLTQGAGTISFSIPVEANSVSSSSEIKLQLTARTVIFSVPGGNAELEFLWGSGEFPSSVDAKIPLMELSIDEPQVEGNDVYISAIIDSEFGLDALAYSDSIDLLVDGASVVGDPIETQRGDSILVTWTWQGASGGEQTIQITVRLTLQNNGPIIQGDTQYTIETSDTGGGTGTYYPDDEPLRTSGTGSPLAVSQKMELTKSDELKLSKTTTLEIGGEMAFWIRWGIDHIGDSTLPTTSVFYGWNPGSVADEDRESREIENVEKEQYERELVKRYRTYMSDINGMQIDSSRLIGDSGDFDTISVSLDLMGESRVVNHPISITFSTLQTLEEEVKFYILRSFIDSQTAPIWSDYSLDVVIESSLLASLGKSELLETDEIDYTHQRFPWGERITINSKSTDINLKYSVYIQPVDLLIYSPIALTIITSIIILFGTTTSFSMTKNKHRRFLWFEMLLIPVVALIYLFAYPPTYVAASALIACGLWLLTGLASPKRIAIPSQELGDEELTVGLPIVACPACSTPNQITSDERPLKLSCVGCGKTIKIVG